MAYSSSDTPSQSYETSLAIWDHTVTQCYLPRDTSKSLSDKETVNFNNIFQTDQRMRILLVILCSTYIGA